MSPAEQEAEGLWWFFSPFVIAAVCVFRDQDLYALGWVIVGCLSVIIFQLRGIAGLIRAANDEAEKRDKRGKGLLP